VGKGAWAAHASRCKPPILEVIAGDTRLTLVEVHGEQQARVAEATRRKLQKTSAVTPATE
jgi:hypothetical protein